MSDSLLWTLLRRNNSKVQKRTHPVTVMTIEKGSLRNKRSRKDSGYANRRAVDVSANDEGIPVLSLKDDSASVANKPDRLWKPVLLSGGVRKAISKADNLLRDYPDNTRHAALAKVSAIYLAQNRKNRGIDRSIYFPSQPTTST